MCATFRQQKLSGVPVMRRRHGRSAESRNGLLLNLYSNNNSNNPVSARPSGHELSSFTNENVLYHEKILKLQCEIHTEEARR